MTLPCQPDIELPLLLQLERAGGRVKPNEQFYSMVSSHFPQITEADRRLIRESTGDNLWENTVDWARNHLRTRGELNGGERGVWEITEAGRQRLRADLRVFGLSLAEAGEFIRSSMTIPQKIGDRWQPRPLRQRPLRRQERGQIVETPRTPRQTIASPVSVTPGVQPPGRALSELVAEGVREARNALRQRFLSLNDTQFERFCSRLLEALGLTEVRVTGRSHDRGIDGDGIIPFFDIRVAFQAKRFTTGTIGGPYLAEFRGRIQGRYDQGIYITTATFTPGAREVAEQPGGVGIILMDRDRIIDLMLEKGLGVKVEPITITRIAEDFFAQF